MNTVHDGIQVPTTVTLHQLSLFISLNDGHHMTNIEDESQWHMLLAHVIVISQTKKQLNKWLEL